ncbi:glycoside hydrolase superfamily [Emericellopsis atlantica]|uniref:alpha-galactosidase n=1 Tax=Emericellopsis atlantica TaxID=2614577 RepID=A0A9P7ZHP7_9HYPO|nr:glycoside hydrolase superfamily [Emericellopsis atlantica]KAG9251735.1 glycoside hydrolase superfamily [Emericellopsis atlantica]
MEKPPKKSWSLRRKLLVVAAIAIVAVVALAVGLGVGLTRGGGSDDNGGDDNDQNNGGGDDTDGVPKDGPDRDEAWKPKVSDSWQIILKYPLDLQSKDDINPDVAVYDLDLYDNDIETFRMLQDAGKKVICYFSAGSWEDWRDDKNDWDEADLGDELDGWPDERWVNVSSSGVRDIIKGRIELAWRKGCDAIDPDNVDGYNNKNGLGLTADDAIDFMRFMAEEAKSRKMAIGLKNAGEIIPDVIDFIDFSVSEQCVEYAECDTFADFVDADKPVFNIEYPSGAPDKVTAKVSGEICSTKGNATGSEGFSKVIKKMVLDGWVEYCDGKTYTSKVQD